MDAVEDLLNHVSHRFECFCGKKHFADKSGYYGCLSNLARKFNSESDYSFTCRINCKDSAYGLQILTQRIKAPVDSARAAIARTRTFTSLTDDQSRLVNALKSGWDGRISLLYDHRALIYSDVDEAAKNLLGLVAANPKVTQNYQLLGIYDVEATGILRLVPNGPASFSMSELMPVTTQIDYLSHVLTMMRESPASTIRAIKWVNGSPLETLVSITDNGYFVVSKRGCEKVCDDYDDALCKELVDAFGSGWSLC